MHMIYMNIEKGTRYLNLMMTYVHTVHASCRITQSC